MTKIHGYEMIGYEIAIHDNDTLMYAFEDRSMPRCSGCGIRLPYFQHRDDYDSKITLKIKSRRPNHDIAFTYDHQLIVSEAFRNFCISGVYGGLEFVPFANDPTHFQLILTNIVRLDRDQSHVTMGKLCPVCNRHDFVVARGIVLQGVVSSDVYEVDAPLPDGFYRSDLSLGSDFRRHPVVLIGIETKKSSSTPALKTSGTRFRPSQPERQHQIPHHWIPPSSQA